MCYIRNQPGVGVLGYSGDGIAAVNSQLYRPYSVVFDFFGNFYIADEGNNRIRKVSISTGIITTIAGILMLLESLLSLYTNIF